MPDIVIDTNIIIWHFAQPQCLSAAASAAVDAAEASGTIYVSAVTLIELVYLTEKGRIAVDVLTLLRDALDDVTTAFRLYEINRAIADAVSSIPRTAIPDMPDRIIAATALYLNLPLVTADQKIQASGIETIW